VKRKTRILAQLAVMARWVGAISIMLFFAAWITWPRLGAAISPAKFAPEFSGESWINSKPLTLVELKGRVVLIEFWTYG